jgi:glucose/arabinose dehydrogenase
MRHLILATALLVVLGACSDDSATTTGPVPTIGPSTTATPTTAPSTSSSTTTAPSTTAGPTTTAAPATTTTVAPPPLSDVDLALEVVADGFTQPVFATSRPGDDRLFVLDQNGLVVAMDLAGGDRSTILDLREAVIFSGERGLLGAAFDPSDPTRMFLHYSAAGTGDTVIEEYRLPQGGTTAEPMGVVLTADQPASNHNGGMIAFGPDGYLYIGLGDGGGANDQFGNGQNTDTLLGSILRIDVSTDPYSIPPDNVFADGQDGAPEIWSYGLRNPWRFAFDADRLFIADVGQNVVEEVTVVNARSVGLDLGWPIYEGDRCFAGPCDAGGLTGPDFTYRHGPDCSITGGYVYRGSAIPDLTGAYFFGDYCSGRIHSFRIDGEGVFDVREWTDTIGALEGLTSFGIGPDGELYATTAAGVIYRFVSP